VLIIRRVSCIDTKYSPDDEHNNTSDSPDGEHNNTTDSPDDEHKLARNM
jgi:hypothetical protein